MNKWKTALWLGTAAAIFALALATLAIAGRSPHGVRAECGASVPDCAGSAIPDYAAAPLHPGYGSFRIAAQGASATRAKPAPAERVRASALRVSENKKRPLPPGCLAAAQLMDLYARTFGADTVSYLDRAQTRTFWRELNAFPPATDYGSDNVIAVGGHFYVPLLAGVGCRVWKIRARSPAARILRRILGREGSL